MTERLRIVIDGDGDDAERAVDGVRRKVRDLNDEQRRAIGIQRDANGRLRDARGRYVSLNTEVERASRAQREFSRETDGATDSVQNLERTLKRGAGAFVVYRGAVRGVQFSSIIAGGGLAVQTLNAVAAAAVATGSALGPLAGLGAAAGGGLVAFAQAAGVAQAASYGVSDAIKAYVDEQESAGSTAVKVGDQVEAAAEGQRSATLRLADAHRQERVAQEQLTAARRQARRDLEDMRDTAGDARLAKRRAALSLQEARAELARVRASPDATSADLAAASLGVAEARRSVTDANREAQRTEADYTDARRRGVNGMPEVVAAQRALADSQRDVAEATRDAGRAAQDAGAAAAGAAGGVSKFDEAMSNLPPSAREFVEALVELRPEIEAIRAASADGLFPGLTDGVQDAARHLPLVRKIAAETSEVLGRNARRAGGIVGSDAFGEDLALVGERNTRVIDRAARSGINLAQAFRHVVVEAGPLLNWLSLASLRLTELIEDEARAGRESGEMARFFGETRDVLEQVASILQSTSAGMLAVGRAARPLGDDILDAIDDSADRWEQWTESIEGQREMRDWFDDAKPAIWELARLLDDTTEAWLRMGADEGTADLIRQLRTELLPVLEDVMENTTEAFGPSIINAIVQVSKLVGELSEAGGPLVVFVDVLATIAEGLAAILETFPQLKTAIAVLAAGASLYKALQLAAALTGVRSLITLMKSLQMQAAATAAIGGLNVVGPGTKGGKGPGTGTKVGGVGAGAAAGAMGGPWGAAAGAALGAGIMFGPDLIDAVTESSKDRAGKEARERFEALTKGAGSYGAAIRAANAEIRRMEIAQRAMQNTEDWAGYGVRTGQTTDKLGEMRAELGRLKSSLKDAKLGQTMDEMVARFQAAAGATRRPLSAIRDAVDMNMESIRNTLSTDSAEGKIAMARNFNLAARSVRDAMDAGVISTETGLAEIRKLMVQKLEAFGFTESQAKNIRKGNRYDGGANEGSAANIIKRAGGGWVGNPGERGRDEVHAVLGRGEAVLNHHQQRVVNAALAETGRGDLQHLFARVNTPHYLATGGYAGVPAFAGGGIVEAGRRIREMGYAVGEHPMFGGVAPGVHSPTGYHPKGLAIDVNADNFPGGEGPALDRLATWLRREYGGKILELLWRVADHYDHLHVAIGGDGTGNTTAGLPGLGSPPEIERVLSDMPGMLGDVSQAALENVRAAAQENINQAFASSGSSMSEPTFTGDGESATGNGAELMRKISRERGWNFADWWELDRRESSHGQNLANPTSTARLRGQFLDFNWGKYGPGSDPRQNPTMAQQIQAMAMYIRERYGNPTRAREHHDAHNWYAQGGFADVFAAAGKPGDQRRTLAKTEPVPVGPAKGRAQPTTGTQKRGWKPRKLSLTGKLANALPQKDQLHNLQVVIDALNSRTDRMGDAFDMTDETVTRRLPVAQVGDDLLRSLGLNDDQITKLRAAEGQEIEVLNQGAFSDGRGITEHVAELTQLIEQRQQIGGFLNSKQRVADGLVAAIQAAIAERKDRLREIAERIKALRDRVSTNTKKIRDTQKDLNAEENKKRPDKSRVRTLRRRLDGLRDERESLIGSRSIESSADEATPRSMMGIALGYRESTRSGLAAYEEELDPARQTAAQVPGELYEGVVSPIARMSKEIGEWLNTAAPRIDIPEAADDRAGTEDEIARLKAQMFDQATRDRLIGEARFGVFEGFAPMLAGRLLGSFDRGVWNVPEDGLAILHEGETVVPSPSGPYGSAFTGDAQPVSVELHFGDNSGNLVKLIDARVDGRAARVTSEQLGHRQRLMTIAPGR